MADALSRAPTEDPSDLQKFTVEKKSAVTFTALDDAFFAGLFKSSDLELMNCLLCHSVLNVQNRKPFHFESIECCQDREPSLMQKARMNAQTAEGRHHSQQLHETDVVCVGDAAQ